MNKLRKLARILGVQKYREALLRYRLPAGVEHEPILKLRDFKTIIDVGSNRGQFALAARHCCPYARIFAFEPLHDAADKFRSFFSADDKITLYQLAAGPASRVAEMHVSARNHSSSLLPITHFQSPSLQK